VKQREEGEEGMGERNRERGMRGVEQRKERVWVEGTGREGGGWRWRGKEERGERGQRGWERGWCLNFTKRLSAKIII